MNAAADHENGWARRATYKAAAGAESLARRRPPKGPATTDLLVVLVAWDPDRTRACLDGLAGPLAAYAPARCRLVVVVNNPDLPLADVPAPAEARVLRGSNDVGEFSGYAEGIAAGGLLFEGSTAAERALLVVNDRFLSYGHGARLRAIDPALCSVAVAERLLVGAVEVFPGGEDYVKSNWMLLPMPKDPRSFVPVDAAALESLVPAAGGPDGWIGRSTLDPGYAHRLEEWLSGAGGQLSSHWYQAAPFTEANWPSMRLKLRSILNEHLLSAQLTAGGLTPVQIEQLEMLARMNPRSRRAALGRARRDPASAVTFPSSPRRRLATALSALGTPGATRT